MDNFIPTTNPFGLATPPAWFLQQLAATDPLLVIFPSVSEPVYRLARRTSTGRAQLNRVLKSYPDSDIYFRHRLWAWKSVEPMQIGGTLHGMTWQKLLLEIPEYDQQRFGTPDQVANRLDEMDADADALVDRNIQTELDARNHDAYIYAKAASGQRVGLTIRKPEGARSGRASRRAAYRPPNFGGGGAIFIGR